MVIFHTRLVPTPDRPEFARGSDGAEGAASNLDAHSSGTPGGASHSDGCGQVSTRPTLLRRPWPGSLGGSYVVAKAETAPSVAVLTH